MADDPILLGDLIADTAGAIDGVVSAGAIDSPNSAMIQRALGGLGDTLDAGVRNACNRDLVGLLVEGWSSAAELRRYGDPTKHPLPMTAQLLLGKHPMRIAIDPGLTLVVGRVLRFRLQFIVEFTATVNAVRLAIIDGEIATIDVGGLSLSAKLRWGSTDVPLPLKSKELPPLGKFELSPRFAIPN